MLTINIAFDVGALVIVGFVVLFLLGNYVLARVRAQWRHRDLLLIQNVMVEYFKKSGFELTVTCYDLLGGKRFVALIESNPLKKLRYSHIVEIAVIQHVFRITGKNVEKIFWRFPLEKYEKESAQAKGQKEEDPYLQEGMAKVSGYQVEEASWEQFAATENPEAREQG